MHKRTIVIAAMLFVVAGGLAFLGKELTPQNVRQSAGEAPGSQPSIRNIDFAKYILEDGDKDCRNPDILPTFLEGYPQYIDLTGDGNEEAFVVGYSCGAGTSGANIYAVYALSPSGEVKELKIATKRTGFDFFSRAVENGKVVEYYGDHPYGHVEIRKLKVTYKWSGNEFVIDQIENLPK